MNITLVTTTIRVPHVLSLYRAFDPDVEIIVVGDRKTPHEEVKRFLASITNAEYYSDTDQEKLGYACSEIIGWNKIMRRNIGFLEAIRNEAEIIISIDDDNVPLDSNYFSAFSKVLSEPYSGVEVASEDGWFNIGELMTDRFYHRGFPYDRRDAESHYEVRPVVNARIGVAEGLWFGDPDVDAMERIVKRPSALHASELVRQGLSIHPEVMVPINTQNTAYIRELCPLFMPWVGVGRYDDIWASYLAQSIMRSLDYRVYYGPPFVWQERNPQRQWTNLRDELFGMENTPRLVSDLLSCDPGSGSVLERLRRMYSQIKRFTYLPDVVHTLGEAWCSDLERVL